MNGSKDFKPVMTTKDVSFPNHFRTKPLFFACLVLAMALSNKAVLVNLFLNDSFGVNYGNIRCGVLS